MHNPVVGIAGTAGKALYPFAQWILRIRVLGPIEVQQEKNEKHEVAQVTEFEIRIRDYKYPYKQHNRTVFHQPVSGIGGMHQRPYPDTGK